MSKVLVLKSSILATHSQSNQLADFLLKDGELPMRVTKSPFVTWRLNRFLC